MKKLAAHLIMLPFYVGMVGVLILMSPALAVMWAMETLGWKQ